MPSALVSSPEWKALQAHQRSVAGVRLDQWFAADAERFRKFSLEFDGMLLDYSRHFLTGETVPLLMALARARELPAWIERLFQGEHVNHTEDRAALHMALRADRPVFCDGNDVTVDVRRVLTRMETFTRAVRGGTHTGFTGKRLTDVVSIGIGGSYLGPQLACQALRPYATGGVRAHFVSNVDGENLSAVLAGLDAATTLFVVVSKTFSTQETMANAESARRWLVSHLGEAAVGRHFTAVTSNVDKVARFGILPEHVFEMWDWVGGRYSLWSAVGLPVALYAGMDVFKALHEGARQMDAHFRESPLERNLPVVLGLLEVWYINFFGTRTRAVLPYAHALSRLPAYLQQLEMESLGKSVARDGSVVDYTTGNIVWGEPGTDSQHSFFQLLHQGNLLIPADLIAACRSRSPCAEQHPLLLANFLAQGEALMNGKAAAAGEAYAAIPGNRPSTSILVDELDARHLGMLLAMYEHKVYVQSVVWNINAFDQWGVALGKQVADRVLPTLAGDAPVSSHDASTNGLINHYKAHRR